MGRDKASLLLHGQTLLAREVEVARAAGCTVCIVGQKHALETAACELHIPIVEDRFIGQGPLAGIHAALKGSSTDLNFVLAVDMPFVTPVLIQFLLRRAVQKDAVVVVPRAGERLHPLCAVYRRGFAALAERALQVGKNKIDALFDKIKVDVVSEDELCNAGFAPEMFDNVNEPPDFARAQARLTR
jgi:molybdopterin-guanine dinucleotide biosynthesis protein A